MKPKVGVSRKYKRKLKGSPIQGYRNTYGKAKGEYSKLKKEYKDFNNLPTLGSSIPGKLKKVKKKFNKNKRVKRFKSQSKRVSRNIDNYLSSQLDF